MTLTLLSFAWILVVAVWWDMEHQIGRMDAALRASAYLDRVLPAPGRTLRDMSDAEVAQMIEERNAHLAPFNPENVAWLRAAEGRGTYLAEADAVAILMGRATAKE